MNLPQRHKIYFDNQGHLIVEDYRPNKETNVPMNVMVDEKFYELEKVGEFTFRTKKPIKEEK